MKFTFWGAAGTTTGSHHLIETSGRRIVLDCGMFQGRREEARRMNGEFPCPPASVDAMILSHAHIDHTGLIPVFVRKGFEKSIVCTHPTLDLTSIMLVDSGFIQEKDAEFVNKLRKKKGEAPVEPLYTVEDAEACMGNFLAVGYYRDLQVIPGVVNRFFEAGHILGSAISQIDIEEGGQRKRVVFSGDIGRGKAAVLRDPDIPADADYLIVESTYGNRSHGSQDNLREELRTVIARVADRGGKIIIPAFSVGRTQDIVYHLNALFNDNLLPQIPIYVDSPLSTNVTAVFRRHGDCFNRPTRELLLRDPDPFGFERLRYVKDVEESKSLNDYKGPCIIIAASGMCEAGRVLHHLRNNIENPRNCVLIVGFQAEHTLGRRIVEKAPKVRIFGEEHALRAEVKVLNGFSAHADADGLREFIFRIHDRGGRLQKVFLVHGEPEGQEPLAQWIRQTLGIPAIIPKRGDTFEL